VAAIATIWTSKEVIGAVIATGILSAVASWFLDGVKSWYGTKKAARYGAMRSAVALERYAIDCWHLFIMGKGEYERHKDMTPMPLPVAPTLAEDINWKAVDATIADDVLSFSNVTAVSESLANYAEVIERNPYDFHEAARERGYEALKLAGRIRSVYGMRSQKEFDRIWKDFAE
jgi:hypothetical protein